MSDHPPETRAHTRQKLSLPAKVRCGGQPIDGEVVDLSEAGCKVAAQVQPVPVGQTVLIKPQGLETLVGRVIWSEEGRFGVAFEQHVYRPVVDHLVKVHVALARAPQ